MDITIVGSKLHSPEFAGHWLLFRSQLRVAATRERDHGSLQGKFRKDGTYVPCGFERQLWWFMTLLVRCNGICVFAICDIAFRMG